jgi:hypothetical protein
MTARLRHDEIILTAGRAGWCGFVTINGRDRRDLGWFADHDGAVTLFPEGEPDVTFRKGQDQAFRLWVEEWHRRHPQ